MDSEKISPIISVIIPVYNVEQFVERSIKSICKQTLQDIEIIIVDDGSTDDSLKKCRKMARKDPRILLIESRHLGVSVAKNLGLDSANGKYVSFIDSDDWIDEDMLQYLYERAESMHAAIATCELVKEYPEGRTVEEGSHREYTADWVQVINEINFGGEFTPYLVNKLFRAELLEGIRFQPGASIGEDYGFLMKVMLKHPITVRGGECKYHYVQRSSSVSYTGYSNTRRVYHNRINYKNTYKMLCEQGKQLADGALVYYILQEMAVVISMVKAGYYDKVMAKSVQKTVRKYLKIYLAIKRVPFYLKCCALLLSIHDYLLTIPYKIIFHKARSVAYK